MFATPISSRCSGWSWDWSAISSIRGSIRGSISRRGSFRRWRHADTGRGVRKRKPRGGHGFPGINLRRWQLFKANRRGYLSAWIFLGAVRLKPLCEFHRQRPAPARQLQRGILFPHLHGISGDRCSADSWRRRISAIRSSRKRSAARAGWCGRPSAIATTPSTTSCRSRRLRRRHFGSASEEACAKYPQGVNDPNCVAGNMNWLGTDDQGRDVIARLIYGFRISVLFGLVLTMPVVDRRDRGGRGAGLYRRLDRSSVPALHRNLDLDADALSADHPVGLLHADLLAAARSSWCCSLGRRSSASCAPNFSGREISNMCARPGPRAHRYQDHVQAPAAQCARSRPSPSCRSSCRDRSRRSPRSTFWASGCRPDRLRSASCCSRARRICRRRGSASPGFAGGLDHAVAPGVHRRGGARRLRSAKDVSVSTKPNRCCSRSTDLVGRRSDRAAGDASPSTRSRSRSTRARPWRSSANRDRENRSRRSRY